MLSNSVIQHKWCYINKVWLDFFYVCWLCPWYFLCHTAPILYNNSLHRFVMLSRYPTVVTSTREDFSCAGISACLIGWGNCLKSKVLEVVIASVSKWEFTSAARPWGDGQDPALVTACSWAVWFFSITLLQHHSECAQYTVFTANEILLCPCCIQGLLVRPNILISKLTTLCWKHYGGNYLHIFLQNYLHYYLQYYHVKKLNFGVMELFFL